jgi:molybdopterin-guanine dinucleotide biosynthesis protein A
MTSVSDFAVVVLAGGEGSRIGGGKPLVMLGENTRVERALERARAWSNRTVVSLRSADQAGQLGLPWIADAPGIDGPLAGLASALEWARGQGANGLLTIPCDMPFLPDELPQRLVAGIGEMGAAIAASGGNLHPVCGLWRTAALVEVPTYCASGKRSLRGFARHIGFAEVEWPATARDPFFNINSPADLAAAEALLGT